MSHLIAKLSVSTDKHSLGYFSSVALRIGTRVVRAASRSAPSNILIRASEQLSLASSTMSMHYAVNLILRRDYYKNWSTFIVFLKEFFFNFIFSSINTGIAVCAKPSLTHTHTQLVKRCHNKFPASPSLSYTVTSRNQRRLSESRPVSFPRGT